MITEDYVSFETAKLLKEKGFNEECLMRYVDEELMNIYDSDFPSPYELDNCDSEVIDAPTLQMAMKWLRKKHKLHIWVDYSSFDFNDKLPYLWNIRETKIEGTYWGGTYHKSYEGAAETAIKYCLENLI